MLLPSLNELLDPGPCLLPHLCDILIRFRLVKMALISDMKQVFLQIQIDTEHQDFLRFLWCDNTRTDFLPSVTSKNTVILPNFLVWKFCGKKQFPHSFGQIARNFAETVPFHKISTPGN